MSKTKKTITVRRQKIKKNHVREKLIFFTILVLILLVIAAALPGNSARMIRICTGSSAGAETAQCRTYTGN